MTRITKPSLTGTLVRSVTGESLPVQKASGPTAQVASARAAASAFDSRRTFSKLTGVGAKPSRGNSHASLGRVDGHGEDESRGRNKGTPDDSIGRNRGTPDDSIGRNRGTPDDSIGLTGAPDPASGPYGTPAPATGRVTAAGGKKKKKKKAKAKKTLSGDALMGLLMGGKKGKLETLRGKDGSKLKGSALLLGLFGPGLQPKARDVGGSSRNKTSRGGTTLRSASSSKSPMRFVPTGTKSPLATTRVLAPPSKTPTQDVLNSRAFQSLPAAQRDSIRNIMSKGGANAAAGMAELFNTRKPELLGAVDAEGVTVLQRLEAIAGSAHPRMAGDILSDIATPKDIEQGYAPTCTTASMQYELAKERPAEYARLLAGLVVDGRVTMAGGGTLTVDVAATISQSDRTNDQRTDSEAVFQTAAMEFANGDDRFSIDHQRSEGAGKVYRGLYPTQIRTMVGELFGERYVTREIATDQEAADELKKLASREGPNRPVLFDLNMGNFNHLVSLESVSQFAVKYRDPATGREHTLSRSDFIQSLVAVHHAESMSD